MMQESRRFRFSYRMALDFSEPVQKHRFALRMIPQSDERQQITACSVRLEPECALTEETDTFGNRYVYGDIAHPHRVFCVEVCGTAKVSSTALLLCDRSWMELAPFRFPSQYTKAGDCLKAYHEKYGQKEDEQAYVYCVRLLHQIYQDMVYVQGVTDIHTTAEEALAGREGVCQDYAHIMIALCRMAGIPSRYVVGMMQGEGCSHAWVEVCADGAWHGMDPTNDRVTDDSYIKISHGRDYQDCIVNRGTFLGNGTQTQTVCVRVDSDG